MKIPPIRPLESNIIKLHVMNALGHARFHTAIYALFLLSKGFSTRDFFLIESAYALVLLLMEAPTGVISDRISRKWSLVVASVVAIPVVPVIIFSDSFFVVLGAMAAGGAASALVSGTDVALLYDTLVALGREGGFQRVLGKMTLYSSASLAVAAIAGGLLAQRGMAYAWWAYFAIGLLALPVRLSLREPPFRKTAEPEQYARHLGEALRISFTGNVGYFVVYAAVIWLFFRLGFWLWQPYLELIAVPLPAFGVVYAAQNVMFGLVSRHAYRIETRLGLRASLLLIPSVLAVALLMQSQATGPLGGAFIFAHSAASGAFSILLPAYINQRIPSTKRATVLSIKNMLNSVLFMVFSPLLGQVVDTSSLSAALLGMAVTLAAVAAAFFAFYGRYHPASRAGGETR